jgi:hypothetical protein
VLIGTKLRVVGWFLSDTISVVSGMKSFVVARFGGTAVGYRLRDLSKVGLERSDRLDGQCCGGLDTIGDDWLPHSDPVLEVVNVSSLDVSVKSRGVGGKEDVTVSV